MSLLLVALAACIAAAAAYELARRRFDVPADAEANGVDEAVQVAVDGAVAAALTPVTGTDAVVLAQASMEPARALLPAEPPVFASPGPGFAAAALAATGEPGPPNG